MQDSYLGCSQKRNSTPAQRQKYNNYTPRKRYIKEQQQFSQYMENQQRVVQQVSPQFQSNPQSTRKANLSSSTNKNRDSYVAQPCQNSYRKESHEFRYEFSEALQDCTSSLNNRPSLRKQKYNRCLDENRFGKILNFDNDKKELFNQFSVRTNREKFVQEQPLTPRKSYRKNEQKDSTLTQKMAVLQQKINKLEKMNPRKSSTPRKSRIIEQPKAQYELQHQQKQMVVTSRVVSQRENQLMSRVSLGRLVEQQECESEIDVIQDLSYKISSKLQTIIRNFG